MRRLKSIFSSQERKSAASQDEDQPTASGSSAPSHDDSWTSLESEIFTPGLSANNCWLNDCNWTTSVEFASDPTAWELQLEKSWEKLEQLLSNTKNDRDVLSKVHEHLSAICKLLVMEVNSQSEPSIGPILDQFFNEEILLSVQKWALKVPQPQVQRCQIMLIRIYENMVSCCQCPQSLLVHKPILIPLLQLLQWCKKTTDERLSIQKVPKYQATAVDRCFVRLINQICRKIAEDETLLHFFFHSSVNTPRSTDDGDGSDQQSHDDGQDQQHKPFLIFDLLVPYVYAPEDVGQLARDALLLIMSASRRHQYVADYIVQKSDFCHLLAGGLSACFSQLPKCVFTKLGLDLEESHKLNVTDVKALPQLYEFHNALLFSNSVAQVAHMDIVRQIASFIYTGFLLKVFKSSILESEPKDELCSRIIYFHLCVDTITSPALLQSFIKVLLVNDGEDKLVEDLNLLEVLILEMQDNERLCRVTLSLIRTLLNLRSEDLIWCTIFRHLIPFITLKPKTQSRRFNCNISLNAAKYFIECIPDCARQILELCSQEQFEAYLREAGEAVREFEQSCSCWKLKYDGNMPNTLLQSSNTTSDELLSARQPFVRLSSARSSFASTGWNRYGHNRSGHGTLLDGSLDIITNLNALGEDEEPVKAEDLFNQLDAGTSSSQEDFSDTNAELANDPRLDYFQFAYEGVSESDPDSCSRRNSEEESQEEFPQTRRDAAKKQHISTKVNNGSSSISQPNNDKRAAPPRNATKPRSQLLNTILQSDWSKAQKSREQFISLLDTLPFQPKHQRRLAAVDENIALIEARWQYLEELSREKVESVRKSEVEPNPFRLDLSQCINKNDKKSEENGGNHGYPMTTTDQKGAGVFLESLFDLLSKMPEHNFATNMQIVGVLTTLLAYPQPLLTTFLLYGDASKIFIKITDLLYRIKSQIDEYAMSTGPEEFDQLIRRGLRYRLAHTDLLVRQKNSRSHLENGSTRSTRGGGFFTATIATMKERQHSMTNGANNAVDEEPLLQNPSIRRNNFAYTAIVHSQICQLMAAFALQHSPAMVQNHGGNGSLSSRIR